MSFSPFLCSLLAAYAAGASGRCPSEAEAI